MSYQVLARKWRPNTFSELVGQEHVVAAIGNALDNDRLHHAYLFTGTRGVGKTTIARIFAKSLNCETGMSSTPCGKCSACLEIEQGRYVDLLEIDAASRTKVEDTRELLDNVQYKPSRGAYKVYLIDEVHMLSKHSFNALLKTLEEPPPHVKFLLATTDPQKLPITILSRCLQFNLKALSREQISKQLQHILSQESISADNTAIAHLARAAQGSMRDALSLTDQAIAQGDGKVTEQVVVSMLGLMDKNQVLKLLHAIANKNSNDVMELVEAMAGLSADFEQVLAELMSLLHQIALTQLVPDICKLETTSAKSIYQLAKTIPAEQVQLLYQIAIQGKKDMPFAADSRIGLEMTLLRMLAFAPDSAALPREQIVAQANPSAPIQINQAEPQASDMVDNAEQPFAEEQADILSQAQKQHPAGFSAQPPNYDIPAEPAFSEAPQDTQPAETPAEPALSVTENLIRIKRSLQGDSSDELGASNSDEKKLDNPVSSLQEHLVEPETSEIEDNQSGQDSVFSVDTQPLQSTSFDLPPSRELEDADLSSPPWDMPDNVAAATEPALQQQMDAPPPVEPSQLPVADTPSDVDIEIPAYLGEVKVTHAAQLDTWSQLIEQMQIAALTKQLALHSSYQCDQGKVSLTLAADKKHLLTQSAQAQLAAALEKRLGQSIDLQIQLGEPINTPFALQQKVNQMRQHYAEQVIEENNAIQLLMDTFAASKIEDSIKPR